MKGKQIFIMLKIRLITKTNDVRRYATKIALVSVFQVVNIVKIINAAIYHGFCRTNPSLGESIGINKQKIPEISADANPEIISPLLICSFCFSDFARKRTNIVSKPARPSKDNKLETERSVVAKPMVVERKKCATIIQKRNPKPAVIAVASIKLSESTMSLFFFTNFFIIAFIV